ncbi:hypothetical protein H310_04398 [Aphanomyces invadans]|uniref:DUF7164 domain-containing protein n=1 Tax=Aphanomyces invadans TaxID=157072 RepID=A0A024UEF5_9STRA|nr:hypothetical protein H310_04398 [Aphanomyces invadans]ETW03993.1 hypothetical protein H310_04398 [Aphanomyces invadans]|eukprot:XP_008866949.1 hypothetical protein H310_04398 [Aphanomyces invadans]
MNLDDQRDDVTDNVGRMAQRTSFKSARRSSQARYTYEHSFTVDEKSEDCGIKGWAEWHDGVLLLYAGHVAINHCTHGVLDKIPGMLDFPTSSDDDVALHAHLHSWQEGRMFSKTELA